MIETPFRLEYYLDENGEAPFTKWLESLRDRAAFARIAMRLDRVQLGNFGIHKALGDGVHELKIDYGPGYPVSFLPYVPLLPLKEGSGVVAFYSDQS